MVVREHAEAVIPYSSLSSHITQLRHKLAPFGIEIETAWGIGWYLTRDGRKKLIELMGKRP